MTPETTPITPESKSSEFITVPEWNETVKPVEALSAESVEQSSVEQEAQANNARRDIEVLFEDDDIDTMKVAVKLRPTHSIDAVPGYQVRPTVVESDSVQSQTTNRADIENAKDYNITVIDA